MESTEAYCGALNNDLSPLYAAMVPCCHPPRIQPGLSSTEQRRPPLGLSQADIATVLDATVRAGPGGTA